MLPIPPIPDGGNSVSHNVTDWDLLNIKVIAKRRENRQWVKIPPKVYFQRNSLKELRDIPNIDRAFIVTGPGMSKRGYVQRVIDELRLRQNETAFLVFDDVEEDPSTNTVEKGVAMMARSAQRAFANLSAFSTSKQRSLC